jgi:hypothetical protein
VSADAIATPRLLNCITTLSLEYWIARFRATRWRTMTAELQFAGGLFSPSLRALATQSMDQHRQIEDGLLRSTRNDDQIYHPGFQTQLRDLAACARVLIEPFAPREQRVQGMPGARCARSLACKIKKAYEHSHHGHAGYTRHSLRDGFNGFLRALPGDRLCCHPHGRNCFRQLDASVETSGPHDFIVRVQHRSSAVLSASTASRPASVTIASAPQ